MVKKKKEFRKDKYINKNFFLIIQLKDIKSRSLLVLKDSFLLQ